MKGFVEVDEKLFKLFIQWYQDNIHEIKSRIDMFSEKVNFYDEEFLIGYIHVYYENKYYIEKEKYDILTICQNEEG